MKDIVITINTSSNTILNKLIKNFDVVDYNWNDTKTQLQLYTQLDKKQKQKLNNILRDNTYITNTLR